MKKRASRGLAGVNSGRGLLHPPVSHEALFLPVAVFLLNVTPAAGEGLLNHFTSVRTECELNQIC
jgi:hypothetical protein